MSFTMFSDTLKLASQNKVITIELSKTANQ